jgi:hypothetical protein
LAPIELLHDGSIFRASGFATRPVLSVANDRSAPLLKVNEFWVGKYQRYYDGALFPQLRS